MLWVRCLAHVEETPGLDWGLREHKKSGEENYTMVSPQMHFGDNFSVSTWKTCSKHQEIWAHRNFAEALA